MDSPHCLSTFSGNRMLSAYERERERNIAANQKVLLDMGLLDKAAPTSAAPRHKRRVTVPSNPTRKSARLSPSESRSVGTAESGPSTTKETFADVPPWEDHVFRECEAAATATVSGSPVWDAVKHHQHLRRSTSGRAIATTGEAGYGAALAKRDPKSLAGGAVRAVRLGVGGFAVGLVRAAMRPPFKSLGRSEHAVAVYHSSGTLEGGGKAARAFGPDFAEGDLIEVRLRPPSSAKGKAKGGAMDVIFMKNGVEVGVAVSGVEAHGNLVLAVQPYMGGVALLV